MLLNPNAWTKDGTVALAGMAVSDDGKIHGIFDNGDKIDLAQVALASFTAEEGLTRAGDGLVTVTVLGGESEASSARSPEYDRR